MASWGAGLGLERVMSEYSFLPFAFGHPSFGAAETREVVCHARACGLHDPETPGKDEGTGASGLGARAASTLLGQAVLARNTPPCPGHGRSGPVSSGLVLWPAWGLVREG